MRREGGSWADVCVPLALSFSFENSELNCSILHKEFEIPTYIANFRDIEVRVFVRGCAHVILRKI